MTIPFYTVSEDESRGAKHGIPQWKARDATKGARKRDHKSLTLRWQKDAMYRAAQTVHGCREEQWQYLDYLATIDISNTATWSERSRYENRLWMSMRRQTIHVSLSQAHVRLMICHMCVTRKNVRPCHALYLRRGVLSSPLLACTTFASVCTRDLTKNETTNVQDSRKKVLTD